MTRNLFLVTGATGTTGRRVADRLTARGVDVRRASRAGAPPFDWADETTWSPTLDGVSAAYLVYSPDFVVPGAVDTVRRFSAAAVAHGVRRLVLLSGRGEEAALRAEKVVLGSGADATVVRCAFFAQNFSEKGFEELVRTGTVALPAPEVGEPFVDTEDVADVVTAALTGDGHSGQVYELTGPRLLTFEQAVAEIAAATGTDIGYRRISAAEFLAGLTAGGVPESDATAYAEIFGTVLDGRNAHLSDGVRRALGRAPRDFAEYARDAATTGVWNERAS
ncbi:MAG: NmrA family transcriptional regulator [Pseudonocardia sp.]